MHTTVCRIVALYFAASLFSVCAAHSSHSHHHDHHSHDDHHHYHHDVHHHGESEEALSRERTSYEAIADACLGSFLTSVVPIAVIPLLSYYSRAAASPMVLSSLTMFAAGSMIGDVFLHTIPSMLGLHSHEGSHGDHLHGADAHDPSTALLSLIAGFLMFYVLDTVFSSSSCSHSNPPQAAKAKKVSSATKRSLSHGNEKNQVVCVRDASKAWLSLAADFTHNVADGLVLGISALKSRSLVLQRSVVLVAHEVPHEAGDFAVLAGCGWSLKDILLSQFLTALGNVAGALAPLILPESVARSAYVEPVVGGSFLYVASVVLVADVGRTSADSIRARLLHAAAFAVGVLCMQIVVELGHVI